VREEPQNHVETCYTICQIGLRGAWAKLVSEHREVGIAKSSRNMSNVLCRDGLSCITPRFVVYV